MMTCTDAAPGSHDRQGLALVLAVFALNCFLSLSAPAQGLPLEVMNPSSQHLSDQPVTFGVPVAEAFDLMSMDEWGLSVVDEWGTPVPCQFRPLSRWRGPRDDTSKPLKWVQVTLIGDLPPNTESTFYIRAAPRVGGQLSVAESADSVTVTAKAGTSFTLSKTEFSVFRDVTVDGSAIVATPGGRIVYEDQSGPQDAVLQSTVIEEQGPVRCVIRQKGTIGNLHFTARFHFHSGRSNVGVDFRLENPGAHGGFFGVNHEVEYFRHLFLNVPIGGTQGRVSSSVRTTPLGNQVWRLNQTFGWNVLTDVLTGFFFSDTLDGGQAITGNRHEGAFDLSTTSGGLSLGMDRFWQNFPKALRAGGNFVGIELWPAGGHGPEYGGQYGSPQTTPVDPLSTQFYRFEGGRWKTFRMNFDFHAGQRSAAEVHAIADVLEHMPTGRAPGWWTSCTGATGEIMVERREWQRSDQQRFERMHDMLIDDSFADVQGWQGQLGLQGFIERGGSFGGLQNYGWDNFGDITWGLGRSSLHYDWPHSVLMQYLRGADWRFMRIGQDMAWHRRDYDQNHGQNVQEHWRGAQSYEKGWWHGNYSFGKPSHTWLNGVLLHYAMTGEEASYEAAMEGVEFVLRASPSTWTGIYGAREPGWSIENLVNAYNYLGLPACLNEVQAAIANFEAFEQSYGGHGYVLNAASGWGGQVPNCSPWNHNIFFNAAAKYTVSTSDPTFLPLLERMRNWFINDCYVPASGPPTARTLPAVYSTWSPTGPRIESLHLAWGMIASFSWSAVALGETSDTQRVLELFDIMAHHHQRHARDVLDINDPSLWSPIAMRMLGFPSSETKIMGTLMLWGQPAMAVRSYVEGNLGQSH